MQYIETEQLKDGRIKLILKEVYTSDFNPDTFNNTTQWYTKESRTLDWTGSWEIRKELQEFLKNCHGDLLSPFIQEILQKYYWCQWIEED
jgi:hypothetical protein